MPFLPLVFIFGVLALILSKRSKKDMQISKNGLAFIIKHEGKRNKAYKDSKGLWTTGVGHLILKHEQHLINAMLTDAQVMDLLAADLQTAQRAINSQGLNLTQNQFDALVSFVFNVGAGAFRRSTLLKKLKEGNAQAAAEQFARWENKKRREEEKQLFLQA